MLLAVAVTINNTRWILPTLCMVAPSPLIFLSIQILQALKPVLGKEAYEYIDETIWSSFQRTVLCFFSSMNGTQAVYSGDYKQLFESKENALVISNHQTNVDWICMNMITAKPQAMGKVRYMHKDELKYIPLFGLYFWQHGCINVGRHGSFRESKTVRQLNHLKDHNVPTWLVIFPEGTRYNPEKAQIISKSQQFAANNGLAALQQTLSPRSRGTYLALNELNTHIDVIYDITIAYESTRRISEDGEGYRRGRAPGMIEFIMSYSPKLHINVRKRSIKDVPHDDSLAVTQWLHNCYERKDRMLERFVKTGQFVEGDMSYEPVTSWSQTLPYNCLFLGTTALICYHPYGRRCYTAAALLGSLAGILWMKFH